MIVLIVLFSPEPRVLISHFKTCGDDDAIMQRSLFLPVITRNEGNDFSHVQFLSTLEISLELCCFGWFKNQPELFSQIFRQLMNRTAKLKPLFHLQRRYF